MNLHVTRAGFDPGQPRDDDGKWTDGGAVSAAFASGKAGSFALDSKLSEQQLAAANIYKTYGYTEMNAKLRGVPGLDSQKLNDRIANMESAINLGRIEEAAVLYRAVAGRRASFDEFFAAIGSTIQIPGFLSTSKDENFVSAIKQGSTTAIFRIYAPAGARALDYDLLSGGLDYEREVVLPHNSTYKVHNVTRNSEGRTVVDLIMQK